MNVSAEVHCGHVESRDVRKPSHPLQAWGRQLGTKNGFDNEFDTEASGTH